MQRVPATKSQRRQNASCDQCRHSKRRCLVDPHKDRKTGTVCNNCKRLRYPCTFNFAESRSGLVSKKQERRNRTSPDQSLTGDGSGLRDRAADGFTDVLSDDLQAGFSASDGVLESWLDFDVDRRFDDSLTCFPTNSDLLDPAAFPLPPTVVPAETQRDARAPLLPTRSDTVQSLLRYGVRPIVGCSLNSPVRLLNSSLNATILDEHLARIYDTITTGSASIFLDYNCNMYTGRCRYRFEDTISQRPHRSSPIELSILRNDVLTSPSISLPTTSPSLSERSTRQSPAGENRRAPQVLASQGDGHKMTVLGAVRFLDHFSALYGNRLNSAARRQSDEVLKEVLIVFSFQWLPASSFPFEARSTSSDNIFTEPLDRRKPTHDSSPNAFPDAWFRARSLINGAQSIRSFRVVYATLLFDTITIPDEVSDDSSEYVLKHEFLDVGLRKLSFLDELVKKYCANLGPSSEYGALMESCLNIIRWFGYLRDTVAALTASRQCRLPDLRSHTKGPSNNESTTVFVASQSVGPHVDGNVPNICRRAIAEAFLVWREIIKIKNAITKPLDGVMEPVPRIFGAITLTMTAVGNFEQSFRPFMDHCIENFANLSAGSRKFSVFLIVFWDLGVLVLAQVLKSVLNEADHSHEHLISRMRTYQWQAALSVAQTAECVLTLPTEEAFKPQSGLSAEVPITACHVTPSLVVTALQKAVEQIIDSQFSSDYGLVPDGVWDRHIGFLMKGLISLEVTIGGSRIAGVALQSLMRNYGDIISECWLGDF